MPIDHTEIVRLKKRLKELRGWQAAAERYHRVYGNGGGHPETRYRHKTNLATAKVEIPIIEKQLLHVWDAPAEKASQPEEPAY